MQPISKEFAEKIKIKNRKISAKIKIDFTDAEIDQSIEVDVSEEANVSHKEQTADGVREASYMWASLDGTWDLEGKRYWFLPPDKEEAHLHQFGWWGHQLAETGGAFTTPYPTLCLRHFPRPIYTMSVHGDSERKEYPVDFVINLYDATETKVYTETVTDNDQIHWFGTVDGNFIDIVRQELIISKWSHVGRQVKIVEFFTSVQGEYYSGDIIEIDLLEEREISHGSLPVGNISSNEINLKLVNEKNQFDVDNLSSPLNRLLKPNRRIRAWIGIEGEWADLED